MSKAPSIFHLSSLIDNSRTTAVQINGKWVPARPIGFYSFWYRLKCAWLAFRGECDLVKWPEGQ